MYKQARHNAAFANLAFESEIRYSELERDDVTTNFVPREQFFTRIADDAKTKTKEPSLDAWDIFSIGYCCSAIGDCFCGGG